MNICNETEFDCHTLSSERSVGRIAVVVVKSTFDVDAHGELRPSKTKMPLVRELEVTEFGLLQSDVFFRKQGCDLCVIGHVQRDTPVRQVTVELSVGEQLLSRLRVSGDRSWCQDEHGQLIPSAPEPFQTMPLSYRRVFGGQKTFDDGSMRVDMRNPEGMGLYTTKDQALGQPVPNIEYADAPSTAPWDHEQRVPGWAPYPNCWALRTPMAVTLNKDGTAIEKVHRSLFNQAHPDLMLDQAPIGQTIVLKGLHEQELRYQIPAVPAQIGVRFAQNYRALPSELDGIFIWPDAAKLAITQRARVIYQPTPELERSFVIQPSAAAA